jgi:hypothetical protein
VTEPVTIALIVAIPPTLVAVVTLIVGIYNAKEIKHKSDEIHILVNSNLTKVKSDLALALERVAKLEKLISDIESGKMPLRQ